MSFSSQSDPSSADTTAGFHYAYDFDNDGTFDVGNGTYAGGVTAASVTVPAAYLSNGPSSRVVKARVIDKDGGFTDYTTTITVNNVPPTVTVGGGVVLPRPPSREAAASPTPARIPGLRRSTTVTAPARSR